MRICCMSQSILNSYNSSKYVTVCVVHLWSIRRTIWLSLYSPSLVGIRFCCRMFSAKLFCFLQEHLVRHSCLSLVLSVQTLLRSSPHHLVLSSAQFASLHTPLLSFLNLQGCGECHCRQSIPDNMAKLYIFPLL